MPAADPPARGRRPDGGQASADILVAARQRFSEDGWAGTTMRAIARDAGVDPALVHYYFASKTDLLAACTEPPARWLERIGSVLALPIEERGAAIVESMIWAWSDPEIAPVLRAIVLIAANEPRTHERLQAIVSLSLIGAVADHLPDDERMLRASLVTSQVLGLSFVRHLWAIEPLASTPDDVVIHAVAPTVQRYLTADDLLP